MISKQLKKRICIFSISYSLYLLAGAFLMSVDYMSITHTAGPPLFPEALPVFFLLGIIYCSLLALCCVVGPVEE